MKLIIESADNGYILSYGEIPDGGIQPETRYIAVEDVEKGKDCISEARLTQKLLFEICEYFTIFTSKHDEEQLRIMGVDKNEKEIEL